MFNQFASMIRDEEGASLVEYALLVGLVAVAAIGSMSLLGGHITTALSTAAGSISN
jgi:pilus assembly protein Flp/PilA